MSKNLLALLIAGGLILLSAIEITYMSTKSTDTNKQPALPLDELPGKGIRSREAVSVHGLPTQVSPGSFSARMTRSQEPMEPR